MDATLTGRIVTGGGMNYHAPTTQRLMSAARLSAQLGLWLLLIVVSGAGLALAAGRSLPAGAQIAFDSERGGDYDVYLMDVERRLTVNLTRHVLDDTSAAWSPDGERLAFASRRDHGANAEIYIMNYDGTGLRRLTDNRFSDEWPVWSPDGNEIAYMSYRDMTWEIYVSDMATGAERRFLENHSLYWIAEWVSDERVTLVSNRQGSSDIYRLDRVTNRITQLTDLPSNDVQPSSSPDGSQIVFSASRNGPFGLVLMNTDGSQLSALFSQNRDEMFPDWSPDGSQIAYSTAQDGNLEIYIFNLATGQQRRMTFGGSYDMRPVWRPVQR